MLRCPRQGLVLRRIHVLYIEEENTQIVGTCAQKQGPIQTEEQLSRELIFRSICSVEHMIP